MEDLIITYKGKNNKINNLINAINNNEQRIIHKFLILELIENGFLNDHIKKIKDNKIKVLKSSLNTKGYLTGYEQFIIILDNFITYYNNYISSPELEKNIISNCLDNSSILLSDKYFYDNENIEFYKHSFNSTIIYNFYNNLLKLKDELKEELNSINLDMSKIDINNAEDVNYLINILEEIIFVNKNDYKTLSLFTKLEKDNYEKYIFWYKILLSKFIDNKNFVEEYRKYKKNN